MPAHAAKQVLLLADELHSAGLRGDWRLLCEHVSNFLGRTHIAMGKQSNEIDVRASSGFTNRDIVTIRERFATDARILAQLVGRQPYGVSDWQLSELERERDDNPLHVFLRERLRLTQMFSAVLSRENDGMFMLGVMAPVDDLMPDAASGERFRVLVPHLRRAVSAAAVIERHKALLQSFTGAFDEVALGVVLCDADGRLLHMNASAKSFVEQGDGLRLQQKMLRLADGAAQQRFAEEVSRTARLRPGRGTPFQAQRPSGAAPLVVTICGYRPGIAAVFVEDPERELIPSIDRLEYVGGLSRAQARVALLVAQGESTAAIARRLGVTENTARTHLRRAFAKLGCADRRQLTMRLAALGCTFR